MDLKCTCLLLFIDVECDETTTFMGVEKPERTELPVLPTQEESSSEKNGNAKGTTANGKSSKRCNISQCMNGLLGIYKSGLACLFSVVFKINGQVLCCGCNYLNTKYGSDAESKVKRILSCEDL